MSGAATLETDRLIPENILDAKDRDINKLVKIEDTFATRTSINPTSYPEEFHMLMAYPRGTPVHVTYFYQNLPDIDHQSAMSDLSLVEHHSHKDFTEVRKLEMRFLSQIETEFKEEDNTWNITVEALMYPGKEPHMGDVFLFEVGNNKIIQFSVNNVSPTTYRQGSYYRITAHSAQFATADSLEELRNCVTDVWYFDKHKFFDDGKITLLKHQSYIDLKKLIKYRKELVEVYMNKFYREDFESVADKNGVYDPYLVEYLKNKISLDDYHRRPEQLDTTLIDYDKSIWYKLSTSVAPDVWDDIYTKFEIKSKVTNPFSPTNNRLDNSQYISLVSSDMESDSNNTITSTNTRGMNYDIYGRPNNCNHHCYYCSFLYHHHTDCDVNCNHCPQYHGKKCTYQDDVCEFAKAYMVKLKKNIDLSKPKKLDKYQSYAFSSSFYNGIKEHMNAFELLVYRWLQHEEIYPGEVLEVVGIYRKLTDEQKYYIIPALLAVIDFMIVDMR